MDDERVDHAREVLRIVDELFAPVDEDIACGTCGGDHPDDECEDFEAHIDGTCECHDHIWVKGLVDGDDTLEDVISDLRDAATYLERRLQEGWKLDDPVSNGHVMIVRLGR